MIYFSISTPLGRKPPKPETHLALKRVAFSALCPRKINLFSLTIIKSKYVSKGYCKIPLSYTSHLLLLFSLFIHFFSY